MHVVEVFDDDEAHVYAFEQGLCVRNDSPRGELVQKLAAAGRRRGDQVAEGSQTSSQKRLAADLPHTHSVQWEASDSSRIRQNPLKITSCSAIYKWCFTAQVES